MATALYRRYRPEAFSEMIGQAHVTEPLMTALRSERIGHAYLFSGPRGCGKTTSARILARCLNCAEGPTDTPCGSCPSCVELSREGGGSLDVVEIDAASHGGVDDARELRERAVFAPARDRYKIFIIDEAHMVTSGGFNALLKIVEEPPPHVKFIFATTEPEKVIGTIRSRTHHYPFRLIAPGTLIDYVQQLCDSEGVQVEPGVLPLVVRSGGGSVRDTLSILDQLIAGSEAGSVTLDRATGLLGFTSAELLDEVVVALGTGDSAQAFAATDRVVQTGQDPRRFVEDLLERLRDLIVIGATNVQGASAVFRGVPDDQLQRMFEQSQAFAAGQLSRIADTVSEALDHMTGATAPRLHLELMIARALITRAPVREDRSVPASAQNAGTGAGSQRPQQSVPAGPAASAAANRRVTVDGPGRAPEAAPGAPAPPSSGSSASVTGAQAPSTPAPPTASPTPSSNAAASSANASSTPTSTATPNETTQGAPQVDVIAAMRSARDFLNSDGPKAPMVPLGGHPPVPAEAGSAASGSESATAGPSGSVDSPADPAGSAASGPGRPAEATTPPTDAGGPGADGVQVGLDELLDVWPALLEELLEADREAWNAVKNVQPLSLEGEILTVGVASRSDLEVFKSAGAGPLREVIVAAVGVSVKYVPRPLPAGAQGSASSNGAGVERSGAEPHDAEPSPAPEAAPVAATPVSAPEAVPAAATRASASGATASVGGSELPPDEPSDPYGEFDDSDSGYDPGSDYGSVPEPTDAAAPVEPAGSAEPARSADPARSAEPAGSAEPVEPAGLSEATAPGRDVEAAPASPVRAETTASEPQTAVPHAAGLQSASPPLASSPPASSQPSSPRPPASANAPRFESTRYGEAVVRELLGARFIEERPVPQNGE